MQRCAFYSCFAGFFFILLGMALWVGLLSYKVLPFWNVQVFQRYICGKRSSTPWPGNTNPFHLHFISHIRCYKASKATLCWKSWIYGRKISFNEDNLGIYPFIPPLLHFVMWPTSVPQINWREKGFLIQNSTTHEFAQKIFVPVANTLEREMNLAFFRQKMKRSANKPANEFENKAILLANSSKKKPYRSFVCWRTDDEKKNYATFIYPNGNGAKKIFDAHFPLSKGLTENFVSLKSSSSCKQRVGGNNCRIFSR